MSDDKYRMFQELNGKLKCPVCEKYFDKRGFTHHHRACVARKGDWSHRLPQDRYLCKFCGEDWPCRDSRNAHQMKCELNPHRQDVIEKIRESHTGLEHSEETKEKIRQGMLKFLESIADTDGHVGKAKVRTKGGETVDIIFDDDF